MKIDLSLLLVSIITQWRGAQNIPEQTRSVKRSVLNGSLEYICSRGGIDSGVLN